MPLSVCVTPFIHDIDLSASLKLPELQLDHPKFDSGDCVLVLHSRPELALARGLAAGLSPAAVVAEWQQSIERLLSITRKHRRFCLWVELEAVLEHPELLLQQLVDRHWMTGTVAHLKQLPPVYELQPAPFFVLLATQLVNESTNIQAILPELEACTLPLSEERHYSPPAIDFDGLLTVYVNEQVLKVTSQQQVEEAQRAITDLEQVNASDKEENKLLLAQLHQVQEELETKLTEASLLKKEIEQTQAAAEKSKSASQEQVKKVQAELADLKKAKALVEEENELLLAQLHQVQEELERQLLLARQTDEDFAQPEKQLPAVVDQQVPQTSGLFKLIKGYKEKRKQLRKATLIANSRWFIKEWYLEKYPDVAKHPEFASNPALHYLKFGGFEGRNPGPEFHSAAYLRRYPDVMKQKMNPLWHYMTNGKNEGRDISASMA